GRPTGGALGSGTIDRLPRRGSSDTGSVIDAVAPPGAACPPAPRCCRRPTPDMETLVADNQTLTATTRTEFGKGAARRTRRANLIPAVLYGHGEAPQHLALESHATFLALK